MKKHKTKTNMGSFIYSSVKFFLQHEILFQLIYLSVLNTTRELCSLIDFQPERGSSPLPPLHSPDPSTLPSVF